MVKNAPANARDIRDEGLDLWVGKLPRRRAWNPTPVFLPGESHGPRSLAGYSPWGGKELDTTEVTEYTHNYKKVRNDTIRVPWLLYKLSLPSFCIQGSSAWVESPAYSVVWEMHLLGTDFKFYI